MTGLRVGTRFELPLEFVVEASAILAMRGAGKTYLAKVTVESALSVGQQVVVLDPKGDWWGLRSDFSVVIFGGQHADVPLTEASGELVADVLVDTGISAILDLSDFSKAAARRFVAAFADRLYWAKRIIDKQTALLTVIDEADAFVPQRIPPGGEKCYGAIDVLVRRGRGRGLGCMLITQRPAVLAKDVLSQVSVLVTMRMGGRHDIQATDAWITAHGDVDRAKELKASLPSLPTGTAWFWAPYLLGDLVKVPVRKAISFDSSATPKPGVQRATPKTLKPVDIEALGKQIAASIETAQLDDPKVLRARIAELERELMQARIEPELVPAFEPGDIDRLHQVIDEVLAAAGSVSTAVSPLVKALMDIGDYRQTADVGMREMIDRHKAATERNAERAKPDRAAAVRRDIRTTERAAIVDGIGKTERNVLTVLVQHGPSTHAQIALLAGYSVKASTIGVALGKLRRLGYVDSNGQPVSATTDGRDALGEVEPLPHGQALQDYWLGRFGLTERRVLGALLDVWPNGSNQADLADRTGYSVTASTIGVALGKLRKVGVVTGWRLSEDFARAIGL